MSHVVVFRSVHVFQLQDKLAPFLIFAMIRAFNLPFRLTCGYEQAYLEDIGCARCTNSRDESRAQNLILKDASDAYCCIFIQFNQRESCSKIPDRLGVRTIKNTHSLPRRRSIFCVRGNPRAL